MTKNSPLVTYLIPCYNQGEYLIEALESVERSYDGPKEIIIINDASDDLETLGVLNEISCSWTKVLLVSNDRNLGLSAARNRGIEMATGEYIQFLDADDVLAEMKVSHQIEHFNLSQDLNISISNFRIYNDTLNKYYEFPNENNSLDFTLDDFLYKWESDFIIPIHAALFSISIFSWIKFDQDLKGKEDWIFWCSLASKSVKMAYLPIYGAAYRRHEKAMTIKEVEDMGFSWLIAAQKLASMFPQQSASIIRRARKWHNRNYFP